MKPGIGPKELSSIMALVQKLSNELLDAKTEDEKADLLVQWTLIVHGIDNILSVSAMASNEPDKSKIKLEMTNLVEHLSTLEDMDEADINQFSFMAPKSKYEA